MDSTVYLCALTSPTHDEYATKLSSSVREINFCQVDRNEENRYSKPLSLAHDLLDRHFAGDLLPLC